MSSKTPLLAETLLLLNNQKYNNDESSSSSSSKNQDSITIASTTVAEVEVEVETSPLLSSLLSEMLITSLASYSVYELLGNLLTQYEWVQTWRYVWPLFIGLYYICFDGGGRLAASASALVLPSVSIPRTLSRRIVPPFLSLLQKEEQEQQTTAEIEKEDILINTTGTSTTAITTDLLLQVFKITCGIGLFVGGFADAFLPVWMTGPNFITNAGLAPDCAILLLLMNIIEVVVFQQQQQQIIMSIIPTTPSTLSSSSTPTSLPLLLLRITLWAELYKLGESSIDEIISSTSSIFVSILIVN
ncbi:hypothetical protein FRACYDRAFT_254423 [Fragilariopsis cylindrus CCMP1102]|uniref:Uncharacterized protein n=1 Tax=Fragilariopsis cylindrus CCMP1102 TaxID=635003 RepID=A0A1E7EL03_9STRA|nr:hypothetical protein FRACYDRAFT_254423 [Fragilariopsis cylindrus CCMP1102]|eukprot:OEU06564.1 hypothetical protein FRACYDRAFT_254423 [Fragilariopsis cylindrus CCMP1102]